LRLVHALCGVVVGVEMLDERIVSVALSEVCAPKGRKVVKGEGMSKLGGGRGDLIIEYDIEFPEQLTLDQKEQLRRALQ
jgi:DnaJ-class molecular chaperone